MAHSVVVAVRRQANILAIVKLFAAHNGNILDIL